MTEHRLAGRDDRRGGICLGAPGSSGLVEVFVSSVVVGFVARGKYVSHVPVLQMRPSSSRFLSRDFLSRSAAVILRLCLSDEMMVQLSILKLFLLAAPSGDDGRRGYMFRICGDRGCLRRELGLNLA